MVGCPNWWLEEPTRDTFRRCCSRLLLFGWARWQPSYCWIHRWSNPWLQRCCPPWTTCPQSHCSSCQDWRSVWPSRCHQPWSHRTPRSRWSPRIDRPLWINRSLRTYRSPRIDRSLRINRTLRTYWTPRSFGPSRRTIGTHSLNSLEYRTTRSCYDHSIITHQNLHISSLIYSQTID